MGWAGERAGKGMRARDGLENGLVRREGARDNGIDQLCWAEERAGTRI